MANRSSAAGEFEKFATVDDMNQEMVMSVIPVLVFIGVMAIIGILGNLTVVLIYSKRYPKCNFKYFVLILAGIDCVSCIVLMPLEIVTFVHWFVFPSAALCKFKSALNVYTVTASASCLLLIAIDRFRKVCRPHSSQIKPELALKLTAVVLCLSLIPATSDGVFWGLHSHYILYQGVNVTATLCEKDDMFKNTIWPKLHTKVLYTGSNVAVMATTIVLYIFIARNLFCQPGPALPPAITISPSDNEEGTEMTVFNFDKDQINNLRSSLQSVSDMDTGLSESVIINGSVGKISDDVSTEERLDETGDRLQVPGQEVEKRPPPIAKKTERISLEIKAKDALKKTNTLTFLEIPEIVMRPKQGPSSPTSPNRPISRYRRRRSTLHSIKGNKNTKLRRKTLIMFILTIIFIITTVAYLGMISYMANSGNIFEDFNVAERTAWLFFLRLYFINSVINPVLYGFLDTRFRRKLWDMGIHVHFLAGSIKRNLGESIKRSTSGRAKTEMNIDRPWAERPGRPKSSTTVSD